MVNDAHAKPVGEVSGPLYDVDIPTPTHAERARTLVSRITTGTLCTLSDDPVGYPYGSFVTVGFEGGNPVFLLSALAEHTRNLQRDSRASLMVAEAGAEDSLANGRVTLLGPCVKVGQGDRSARQMFLETHPNASYYCEFKDFSFWRLQVESIRYIGGYGRMSWVEASDWHSSEPDPLGESAVNIIEHMNKDHPDAMVKYCKVFSKATDVTSVSMTAVDRYGFEMSAVTKKGPRPIRLAFSETVRTSGEARDALVSLLKEAERLL